MELGKIISGHVLELLNEGEELFNQRWKICKECKLMKQDSFLGPICNSNLWLNISNNEVSDKEKPGFYNGCGCRLNAKLRVSDAHCGLNKW